MKTKKDLKTDREIRWRGRLNNAGISLDLVPWWVGTNSVEDITEISIWKEVDAIYEVDKKNLLEELKLLSDKELTKYWIVNELEPQDLETWLFPSPTSIIVLSEEKIEITK